MMTQEKLFDKLNNEITWRKREIILLASILTNFEDGHELNTLLRSSLVILYSHWEGFIEYATNKYIEFIADKAPTYRAINHGLIAGLAMKRFTKLGISNKLNNYHDYTKFLLEGQEERAEDLCGYKYKTNNLNSEELKNICLLLNIDYQHLFAQKQYIIDNQLVLARNTIAHGQYSEMNFENYKSLQNEILILVDYFKNTIQNLAIDFERRSN